MVINAIYLMSYPEDKELLGESHQGGATIDCILPGEKISEELLTSAHVIIGDSFQKEWIDKTPDLQYYLLPYAGVPQNLIPFFREKDLTVSNIHCNSQIVAEHAFAMLLSLGRNIIEIDKRLRKDEPLENFLKMPFITLSGKKLLIVGYGSIGKAVEKIARGFSMEIDRVGHDLQKEFLPEKLKDCDVACICLPLTEKTYGFIGSEELACMKESSILINVARGEVVDEQALYNVLKEEKIFGACIDTWYGYTKIKGTRKIFSYPFGNLKNLVMSPHVAFRSDNQQKLRVSSILEYLDYLSRGTVINKVDLSRGY